MPENAAVQYFLPFTIGMINLSLGLGLVREDFRRIAAEPRSVTVGALAQLVGLPLVGFACAALFGLGPELACGYLPVSGLLLAARRRDMHVHPLDLRNSGDTAGSRGQVVGYGAWTVA